jgi:hypothetical protein
MKQRLEKVMEEGSPGRMIQILNLERKKGPQRSGYVLIICLCPDSINQEIAVVSKVRNDMKKTCIVPISFSQ